MRALKPMQIISTCAALLALCAACAGSMASRADEAVFELHGKTPRQVTLPMDVPLRECLAQRLGAGTQTVVRLYLHGIESRNAAGLKAVHLYLQVPPRGTAGGGTSADSTRSEEDRLGALVLGFAQGESHVWDLGPLLASQWRLGRRDWTAEGELRLELVPEAWEHTPLGSDFRLSVREFVLEAPACSPPA
jgi:hypothetical protein